MEKNGDRLFRRPKLTLSCSAEREEGRKKGRKEGRKERRKSNLYNSSLISAQPVLIPSVLHRHFGLPEPLSFHEYITYRITLYRIQIQHKMSSKHFLNLQFG
jgi:hypothetical protein